MKLSEFDPSTSFNVLIKGDPGTGKTPIACSFPTPTLLFDCDFRAKALQLYFQNDPQRLKEIEVIQPTGFEMVKKELERQYNSRRPVYKTIILDPLTTYADISIRDAINIKGSTGRTVGSIKIAGMQEYGDESAILTETITLMRLIYQNHNINTILVAHVITSEDKEMKSGKTIHSRSLLTGGKKVGSKIPSYFDEVWHTYVRPGFDGRPEFVCQTRHTGFDFARTGLDLPDELIFTNYERDPKKYFYQLIKGAIPNRDDYLKSIDSEDKIQRQEVAVEDDKTGEIVFMPKK